MMARAAAAGCPLALRSGVIDGSVGPLAARPTDLAKQVRHDSTREVAPPARPNQPGIRMLIQLLATTLILVALFALSVTFLMVGAYAAKVPGGDGAMGLIVPIALAVVGAVLLLGATGLALLADRLSWVGPRPGLVSMSVAFGVGAAAVVILIAWMEKAGAWVAPVGLIAGGAAPWIACGLLLASLWAPQALAASPWTRWLAGILVLSALSAPAITLVLLADHWAAEEANAERGRVAQAERDAEQARRDALTPVERRREDYAGYSPDTPLWVFVTSLPGLAAGPERDLVVDRALQVPDFQRQLEATITTDHPVFRHSACELLRLAPDSARMPQWNAWLARAIAVSAAEIAAQPDWLQPKSQSNPDPVAHIGAMVAAADRVGRDAAIEAALVQLREAMAKQPAGPAREQALAALSR